MSDLSLGGFLSDEARSHRLQREAELHQRRIEHARLQRFREAVEARGDVVRRLLWALDPFNPPLSAEAVEEHCTKITAAYAATLAALREAGLQATLCQVDEPATLAHYRQRNEDPQAVRIAYRLPRELGAAQVSVVHEEDA